MDEIMNVVWINVCPVYKAMKLDSEIRNGRFDDGGGGHRGVDDGDPLGGGDPQQVMLALHQARRHELTPFHRPTPHLLGVHLRWRLLAHELHQNSLAGD